MLVKDFVKEVLRDLDPYLETGSKVHFELNARVAWSEKQGPMVAVHSYSPSRDLQQRISFDVFYGRGMSQ